MLKTAFGEASRAARAYHLGEGHVLKTNLIKYQLFHVAYHLGEGRVLKTGAGRSFDTKTAYHLGEGRVLKTWHTY